MAQVKSRVLDAIQGSLAYEADTHRIVFPHAKTLWLDNGRPFDNDEVTKYAKYRLDILKNWMPENRFRNPSILLSKLCEAAWAATTDTNKGNRDKEFVRQIINQKKYEWAIVIVGNVHTRNSSWRMRYRLEEANVPLPVSSLRDCAQVP